MQKQTALNHEGIAVISLCPRFSHRTASRPYKLTLQASDEAITKYGPLKVPSDTEDSMMMICSCSLTRIIAYRGYCTTSIFSQCCASRHKRVSSWWVFCTKGQKGWKRVTEPIFAEGEPWEAWSGPRMLHIAHPQLWSWGDRGHLQALLPHASLWPSYTISTVLGKGKCSPNF